MPTSREYSARLLPLLTRGSGPQLLSAEPGEDFSIEALANTLGGILEELERQHAGASSHIRSLLAGQPTEPWEGHGELAFLLYYLHYPPAELRSEIDAQPELKLLWEAMAAVAPASPFTPDSFSRLAAALPTGSNVTCNEWGDIYGLNKYEQLDAGWAWTLKNDLMNHLPRKLGKGYGLARFVSHDWKKSRIVLQPGKLDEVRIAIIGDWGSGDYKLDGLANRNGPASAVMETLRQVVTPEEPLDYLIHLGDTYYSGTGPNRSPTGEEANHLVAMLERYPSLARAGRCFTLNSNHEMYGGAHGYYGTALAHKLFRSQQGCSYFALEYGNWIVAAIDSAYFDPSSLYMQGGLGDEARDPQYKFLRQIKSDGKKLILLSHHTGISTDGRHPSKYLWDDVNRVITPDYWYWGHTHLGAVYNSNAFSGRVKTRCIGHSSMPFAIPPGMEKCRQNVDWYSHTPLDTSATLQALLYSRPRAKNGFAMLTLRPDSITEQVYEIGNKQPVWSCPKPSSP